MGEAVFDAHHAAYSDLFADALDQPTFPLPTTRFVVGGESFETFITNDAKGYRTQGMTGSPAIHSATVLARLGNRTGFLGAISTDNSGDRLLLQLSETGVEALMPERIDVPTTKALVEVDKLGNTHHRFVSGADAAFRRERLLAALPENANLLHLSGFVLMANASVVDAWIEMAEKAVSNGTTLSVDIDVRPALIF